MVLSGGAPPVDAAWSSVQQVRLGMPESAQTWLSPPELRQCEALRSELRRSQYLAARWLARVVLATIHGCDPRAWALSDSLGAAPRITHGPACHGWRVSLTHSADQIACAVASSAVGIDLEVPRPGRDIGALAQHVCARQERLWLEGAGRLRQERRFYALWTVKEAWIKRDDTGASPARLAGLCVRPVGAPADVSTWRMPRVSGCTLALAAPAGSQVRWHGSAPRRQAGWAVTPAA